MFELEYEIKMKAQLKYLEGQDKSKQRKGLWNAMSHDYLWTPTTTFYMGTLALFMILRHKYKWQVIHVLPFMMIPVTADFLKRDHYAKQFSKENQELTEKRKIVQSII